MPGFGVGDPGESGAVAAEAIEESVAFQRSGVQEPFEVRDADFGVVAIVAHWTTAVALTAAPRRPVTAVEGPRIRPEASRGTL